MATLYYWQYMQMQKTGEEEPVRFGSLQTAESITVDGLVLDQTRDLATATTWTAWTTGDGGLTDFDWIGIQSDYAVFVEFVCDTGAEVGTVVFAKEIQAGVPFSMHSDDAYANYTANFASGTEDVIDKIRIRNVSGSTARVRVVTIT